MHKSLLELLKEENKEIENINFREESIREITVQGHENFTSEYEKKLHESK